jgi:hypothetical protein
MFILLITAVLIALYAGVILVACGIYRYAIYPAPSGGPIVAPPGASMRELRAKDGVTVRALHIPAPPGGRTVVHFHGNGETVAENTGLARAIAAGGLGVLLVEYRGYGLSKGASPTEAGLYLDAEAALDALVAEGVSAEETVLFGTSLGTGVAAEMASRGRGAALVLITPYTSMVRMVSLYAPFLPASLYVSDRFDTLSKAPRIRVPTLVIHGDSDELIPHEMGQEVAAAIAGARLITVPGGHHNDLFVRDGDRILAAIIELAAMIHEPK